MSPRPRRARSTAMLAATILTTLGCGDADAPFAGTYVARIDETPEDSPGATPFAQLRGRLRGQQGAGAQTPQRQGGKGRAL